MYREVCRWIAESKNYVKMSHQYLTSEAGAAVLEAETRYFETSEMLRAWEWVRTAKHAEDMPVRQISAGSGIWKDYHPEYMDL